MAAHSGAPAPHPALPLIVALRSPALPWVLRHHPLPLRHRPSALKTFFALAHFLLIPLLPLGIHTHYKEEYILCVEYDYNAYNLIADAACSKKVRSIGVPPLVHLLCS